MNRKTDIAIVGTVGVPALYGGFESLVENLLPSSGKKIKVYCSSKKYDNRIEEYKGASLTYIPLSANGAQSIIYDILCLLHCLIIRPKSILVLGVSGCIFLPLFRLLSSARIVTNIDGLEWKRDKWSKPVKYFLKFSERLAVNFSHEVVSDNEAIYEYVLKEYGIYSHIIAYGGDHAVGKIKHIFNNSYEEQSYALSLCRIEPENNVDLILSAFSQSDRNLKFIGNWSNSSFGLSMKEKYSNFDNIELLDPIYDIDTLTEIRQNCEFYVHGHSAGGTNPSLVEMMHFSKPILCFDCSYNRATTEDKAIYFQDVNALRTYLNHDVAIDYGEVMREIARRRYTWKIVKSQYLDLL